MPNIEPIIGAAVKGARKIAGIVGAGAKDVNPTYRMGTVKIGGGTLGPLKKQIADAKPLSKVEAKANARGLKAANKPTNKTGNIADRQQRADLGNNSANLIKNADPARPNRVRGGSLHSMKTFGGVGDVAAAMKKSTPKNIAHQISISKELNPVRKPKK